MTANGSLSENHRLQLIFDLNVADCRALSCQVTIKLKRVMGLVNIFIHY